MKTTLKKLTWFSIGLLIFTMIGCGIGKAQGTGDTFSSINLSDLSDNGVLELSGTNVSSFKSFTDDELTALVVVLDATPTIPVSDLPTNRFGNIIPGTYWSLKQPDMPPLPDNVFGVDVWPMADGSFLLDDIDTFSPMRMGAMADGLPSLPGGGGTNAYTASYTFTFDPGTNLWIAQWNVATNIATGIASNTIADVSYEMLWATNLLQTNWTSLGFIVGSEITNWTVLIPQTVITTNNGFLRLRSWESSDGSGLPDWWELEYFGATGIDSDALDAAGDGYTIYQKYLMGLNPNVFYTPATPQGLIVNLQLSNQIAAISWVPSAGSVTGYTVEKTSKQYSFDSATVQDFSTSTANYADDISGNTPDPTIGNTYNISYRVRANYTGGNYSAWSSSMPIQQQTVSGAIVAGVNGLADLAVSGVPANATIVRLVYIDNAADGYFYQDPSFNFTHDIAVSQLTNGAYQIPAAWQPPQTDAYGTANYSIYTQSVDTSNNPSASMGISFPTGVWAMPFYDDRAHLKQNLIFQLRAATASAPFSLREFDINNDNYTNFDNPPTYVYASYYDFNRYNESGLYYAYDPYLNVFEPFSFNYLYRNLVYNSGDIDANGLLTTGVDPAEEDHGTPACLQQPLTYQFATSLTNSPPIPSLLATNQTRWFYVNPFGTYDFYDNMGVTNVMNSDYTLTFTLLANFTNWFGLPILSVNAFYPDPDTSDLDNTVISPGGSITSYGYPNLYFETAQPQFQTVEYDFWQPQFYPLYDSHGNLLPGNNSLPGMPYFTPTNQSQLIITSVGKVIQIAGYAKLAVTNSVFTGVYGYLGQYFDQAYEIATNGNVTTNVTGILSPYGNFIATEAGPAALVTMPDPDTGEQGTGIVHCISLNVDKNHDGTIDTSFNGPDTTSQASPMEFWINNDNDGTGIGEDIDAPKLPDSANNVIQSIRDLEDFTRLWICGVPSGSALNGYQVSLSFQNCAGNPSIKLFGMHEAPTGTGYLNNSNTAELYVGDYMSDFTLGSVSTTNTYVFPYLSFYNGGIDALLFEGVTAGKGELVLTITDSNSNTIAQTGVWLDLHDVKDFLEQAVITDNVSGTKSNWTSAVEIVEPATTSGLGDDTNLIVLVHGINVRPWDCLSDAETVYKRLYWSGFQGQFCAVQWPCNLLTPIPSPLSPANFNDSELQGYKAATAFTNYIQQLRARFPGYRLNILTHSQGNSVVSEAITKGLTFDTYILTQGAIPDSAYDVNAPIDSGIADYEQIQRTPEWQPMGYHGIYTNFTGNIVNFYNPQDGVLDIWGADQEILKPSFYFNATYYYYDGTNSYFYPSLGSTPNYLVTDLEESRADVSRSRTLPIGQSSPASPHGVITSAVDLNAQFGFNNAIDEHSAQWTRPIQTSLPYYIQVLESINP